MIKSFITVTKHKINCLWIVGTMKYSLVKKSIRKIDSVWIFSSLQMFLYKKKLFIKLWNQKLYYNKKKILLIKINYKKMLKNLQKVQKFHTLGKFFYRFHIGKTFNWLEISRTKTVSNMYKYIWVPEESYIILWRDFHHFCQVSWNFISNFYHFLVNFW